MITAIIQARMSSERLPGKVLMPIKGIPMLLIMLDRVSRSKMLDNFIVATSVEKTDDTIKDICELNYYNIFRGSLEDVLDRFFQATQVFPCNHIVRLTADCPLIDPEIIDHTIKYHLIGGYDFTWNPGFPDGLDVEVMTHNALNKAWIEAKLPDEREHVTKYFRKHPDIFKTGEYRNDSDLSYLKLSVDTPEDFYRVERFIEYCLNSTIAFVKEHYR